MNLDTFQNVITRAAANLLAITPSAVLLLHHNDADGLTSGAILSKAFERSQIPMRRVCLEKPYPEVVQHLLGDPDIDPKTIVVIADFGSGMLATIAAANRSALPIFVLDHHTLSNDPPPSITIVNPRQHSVNGDSECSAAMVCAFFAAGLGEYNSDLFKLAVVGACGDHQISALKIASGLNALGLEYAVAEGGVRTLDDSLSVVWKDDGHTTREISSLVGEVDALGAYGYLRGGTDVAIKGLLEGFDQRYIASASSFRNEFDLARDNFLRSAVIHSESGFSWFALDQQFTPFGVKSVGLLCEQLIARGSIPRDHYVIGFQALNATVPGLAVTLNPGVKISMRAGPELAEAIAMGQSKSVATLLTEATSRCSGFIDACHQAAGAATIPVAAAQLANNAGLESIENVQVFIRELAML